MLSEQERVRVEAAVREAERGTAGEIVVVLAGQAASYKSLPLAYSLLATLAVPWPLILLTDVSASRIALIQAAVALLVLGLAIALGLAAVPAGLKRERARAAAMREFASRGLADTRGRTGILLYVALAERYAEVIGDVTISETVAEAEWRGVIDALLAHLADRKLDEALVAAVERMGTILARHVPPGSRDEDELPNRVVIL